MKLMTNAVIVTRVIVCWMVVMSVAMAFAANSDPDSTFYRFGPQPNLVILGFTVDTYWKYALLICYALINTCIRNLDRNVITPWLTLHVQDNTPEGRIAKKSLSRSQAYEVSLVQSVYTWFDWLVYIHMLLAQIDMVMIEMVTDFVATGFITRWYLQDDEARIPSRKPSSAHSSASTPVIKYSQGISAPSKLSPFTLSSMYHRQRLLSDEFDTLIGSSDHGPGGA